MSTRRSPFFWQLGLAATLIGLWEAATREGVLDSFIFGSPSGIIENLGTWLGDGTLLGDTAVTMSVLLIGWTLGMAVGVLVGVGLHASPFALRVASPYLAFLNATPRMVFYPFFGILLGFGLASKVGLVVFVVVFFAILNVITGLSEVDRDLVSHVRVVGGNRATLIWNVYAPSLASWMISSSRVTFAFALQATLISEFFGPAEGLGFRVVAGQGAFEIDQVWAAISVTVLLALVIDGALQFLRRRLTSWETA